VDIFLTGGSGFAGQYIIAHLVADGHKIRALARSPQAARRVTQAGARPVHGDLADLVASDSGPGDRPVVAWLTELDGCEAVVHAAARMEFWGSDAGFERDNLRPSVALFTAAASAGVKRFVLISAAAVSTGRRGGPAVVDEATPADPSVVAYGRVKLATDPAPTQRAASEQLADRPPGARP